MGIEDQLKNLINDYKELRDKYLAECRAREVEPDAALLGVDFSNGQVRSIREAILSSVSANEVTNVSTIINRVKTMIDDGHDISIRNEISKLKKEGFLEARGHGSYVRTPEVPQKKSKKVTV